MDRRRSQIVLPQPRNADTRYSSKIIKAGALLADTKTLLSHWDATATVQENLDRIRRENVFGKASRSRVEDILAIFRQRYLVEEEVTEALVVLVKERLPAASLDRILYFHAARVRPAAPRCRDRVAGPLAGPRASATSTWTRSRSSSRSGSTRARPSGEWSEITTGRVAQGLLSTLRDFGVLQGAVRKRIAPAYLPVDGLRLRHVLPQAAPALGGQAASSIPTGGCSSCPGRASSGSCSRPTSAACWNTMRRAA